MGWAPRGIETEQTVPARTIKLKGLQRSCDSAAGFNIASDGPDNRH